MKSVLKVPNICSIVIICQDSGVETICNQHQPLHRFLHCDCCNYFRVNALLSRGWNMWVALASTMYVHWCPVCCWRVPYDDSTSKQVSVWKPSTWVERLHIDFWWIQDIFHETVVFFIKNWVSIEWVCLDVDSCLFFPLFEWLLFCGFNLVTEDWQYYKYGTSSRWLDSIWG